MAIKTVIFDFDGTIADTFDIALASANSLAEEFGFVPLKDSPVLRQKSLKEIVRTELGLSFFSLPRFVRKLKTIFRQKLIQAKVVKGLRPALAQLRKKYSLAILTSNTEDVVKHIIARDKITADVIFTDVSVFGKAHAIKHLLRNLNLDYSEVVYVGDELRDVEACKKVGVKIAAVTWGYNSKDALKQAKPDALITSPSKLSQAIFKLDN